MKSLFIFFPLVFVSLCFAQNEDKMKDRGVKSVRIVETETNKKGEQETSVLVREYDKKGNLVAETEMSADDTTQVKRKKTWFYDGEKLKEEAKYNAKLELKELTQYNYDSFGKESYALTVDADKKVLSRKDWQYDNLGQKKAEITQNGEGKVIKKETFEYDDRGLMILKREYDKEENLVSEKRMHYTY